jgi:hypothetical protein
MVVSPLRHPAPSGCDRYWRAGRVPGASGPAGGAFLRQASPSGLPPTSRVGVRMLERSALSEGGERLHEANRCS